MRDKQRERESKYVCNGKANDDKRLAQRDPIHGNNNNSSRISVKIQFTKTSVTLSCVCVQQQLQQQQRAKPSNVEQLLLVVVVKRVSQWVCVVCAYVYVYKKCTLNTHSAESAVLEHLEHSPTTNGMQLFWIALKKKLEFQFQFEFGYSELIFVVQRYVTFTLRILVHVHVCVCVCSLAYASVRVCS